MPLLPMRVLLDHAAEHDYGVGAFNVNNMEQIQAIMMAATETNSPVIVQASRGARSFTNDNYLRHLMLAASELNPGKFNFSSTGVGSLSQLGVELLKVKTDTYAVHIPYASSPLAVLAILQGDVQFACVPAVAVLPQVKAGKLRTLAVSTAQRSQLTPDIPTMKEAGLPEIENLAWMAVMAPASTPTDIVQRMNREINAVLAMPEVREKLHAQYMEPIGGTPEALAQTLADLHGIECDIHIALGCDESCCLWLKAEQFLNRTASACSCSQLQHLTQQHEHDDHRCGFKVQRHLTMHFAE